jgi:energy-coupling factor transporter ATP-binding protein EcfA2
MAVHETPIENGKTVSYYIEDKLKEKLDKRIIPALKQQDKDRIILLDGDEGAGKSTLAVQIGKYVDPSLNLNRIVFTPEEFRDAVFKANKGQCIIYDEAFTGLSSRASLSGINRALISLMMQMRQKNLFVIIVLPTFFLLDKYAALFRSIILIHVYEVKNKRGYFKVYNKRKKKLLYMLGKATYSYYFKKVHTRFMGRFYGKFALGENMEEKYRKRKEDVLQEVEKSPMSAGQVKYMNQRNIAIYTLRKQLKLTYRQLANLLDDYDMNLDFIQIRNICAKFGDSDAPEPKKGIEPPPVPLIKRKNRG